MAGAVRPAGRVARLAALIAGLLIGAESVAQEPLAGRGTGTTLYLVVRTKPSVPEKRVIDTIEAGLDASAHVIDGKPVPKNVSPLFFDQFAELIGSARSRAVQADTTAGKVGIRPLPSREGQLLEFQLPSAKQTLTSLDVEYAPAADGKTLSNKYVPKPPGDKASDNVLTLIEPGRYAFRPSPGRVPTKFSATVDERDDKTKELVKDKKIDGDWPSMDKFYVVSLYNLRKVGGGRHDHESFLREIERQNLNAANPINISRLGGDQLFVFADMAGGGARVGSLVVGNSLELRVPAPVNRTTRRAWVLFPLSEDAYKAAVEKYSNFNTTDMPGEVRKNAVSVSEDATVGPGTPARWIEVPPEIANPGVLYRRVPLNDLPGLATKYPKVWQLTVYEFEHPTKVTPLNQPEREAIQIKNEKDQDVTALGAPIFNWESELRRIVPK